MAAIRPEDLGSMGESFFKTLCKSVGLIANKSDDDKGGWDYEVEHPRPQTIGYASHAYPVYRIQVKATSGDKRRCRITYSNLLNLIEYHGAAFILLLTYDGATEPMGDYLRHVDDAFSSSTLTSIRKRQLASPNLRLNRSCETVKFDDAHVIHPITGNELLRTFAKAIGEDYLAYVQRKVEHLRTLESEGRRREATWTFRGKSELTAFADCLLGFHNTFTIDCELYDAPLGIRDKHANFNCEGLVTTVSVDRAKIPKVFVILRNAPCAKEYRFAGRMYMVPPDFPSDAWGTRIETALFDIVLRTNGPRDSSIRTKNLASDIRVTFRELRDVLDFLVSSCASEETFMRLESECGQKPAEIRIGKLACGIPDDLRFMRDTVHATYLRIREHDLDTWEISTRDIILGSNHCHCISLADKAFDPPHEVSFEAAGTELTHADTVIFKAVINFTRKKAFVVAVAFFGKITKGANGQFAGRFDHSRTLGEYIVSTDGKEDAFLASEEDKLKSELATEGHTVL